MEGAMWDEEDDALDWYLRDEESIHDTEDDVLEYGGYIGDEAEWARDYDRERM